MIVERETHPGRASHVLADEAAAAMGLPELPRDLPERDKQRLVGNAITDVMAKAVMRRAARRVAQMAARGTAVDMAPLVPATAPPRSSARTATKQRFRAACRPTP